jgi:hypothetical protein
MARVIKVRNPRRAAALLVELLQGRQPDVMTCHLGRLPRRSRLRLTARRANPL